VGTAHRQETGGRCPPYKIANIVRLVLTRFLRVVNDAWLADRMKHIDASGIRKAFDMSKAMKDPINLSIGLPDFDVPEPVQAAAIEAIRAGHNAYTVTQGIPELRTKIQGAVDAQFGHADRQVLVTAGTSGALLLALCCVVNPGDEVIVFDPYFVMYRHLVTLAGGVSVLVDTYPDFRINRARVEAAMTERTKCVVVNTPANPTGVVATAAEMQALAELCRRRDVLLISDEVYRAFCYGCPFDTPASWNDDVLVVDGFSKAYAMTGWRLGYAHGPNRLIQEMAKLQQFSYVCAPSMAQYGGVAALDQDLTAQIDAYRRKRDMVVEALSDDFELSLPEGAFYAFPRAPWGTGSEFVAEAIKNNLLIIPGNVFSTHDTHFRISYAVDDATLRLGLDLLRRLARSRRG
jgi:aspartate/methionine/tyrosine aminotransferase